MGEHIWGIFEVKRLFFSAMYGHILHKSRTVQEVPLELLGACFSKQEIRITLGPVLFH
jgi:hypothetical protein